MPACFVAQGHTHSVSSMPFISRVSPLVLPLLAVAAVAACEDETSGGPGAATVTPTIDGGTPPAKDASTNPGNDAGDAGEPPVTPQPGDLFVNATSGSDDASGLVGQPFKTITKALSVATAPKSVWLEDGVW